MIEILALIYFLGGILGLQGWAVFCIETNTRTRWQLWSIGWPLGVLILLLMTVKVFWTTAVGVFKKEQEQ